MRNLLAFMVISLAAVPANASSPLADVTSIGTGNGFACALTSTGAAHCWGRNTLGQLGDGTAASYPAPRTPTGLASGVAGIAVGSYHACALTTGGGVKCWGGNDAGQVGDGTTTNRLVPVDVVGLSSGVAAIWAGGSHTCALTTGGGLKCWGSNFYGQLGDGSTTNRLQPVDVLGLTSGVTAASAGGGHTCAIVGGGALCWGENDQGQLGDGTNAQHSTAVGVSGLASGVAAIFAGGQHTCALTTGGAAKCWGYNYYGQLGNGTTGGTAMTPQNVVGMSGGVLSIAPGSAHTCAVVAGGSAKCWGSNLVGELGTGTAGGSQSSPVGVTDVGVTMTAISTGIYFTCAVASSGQARCWGQNIDGQLGRGGETSSELAPAPVMVFPFTPLTGVTAISTESEHVCVILVSGGVQCWGLNDQGQLGDGTQTSRGGPLDVTGLTSGVIAISAGNRHSCAVTSGGGVKCWGSNQFGQLGDGTITLRTTPVDVSGLSSGVVAVWAGGTHTCALTSGGGVKCWGENTYGELGDGTNTSSLTPVDVLGLGSGVASGSAGYQHSCALMSGGGVKCWGKNDAGNLGDGTTTNRYQPVDVTGLASGVLAIDAAQGFTCALMSGGAMKCWGSNSFSQLGIGSSGGAPYSTPQAVVGLGTGALSFAAGSQRACAIVSGGAVKCWGFNFLGELGFPGGNPSGSPTPTDVPNIGAPATTIVAGLLHSCVLVASTEVRCWGSNRSGQIGRGPLSPQIVIFGPTPVGVFTAQAITFPAIANRDINNSPFNATATASSGLAVTFTSLTTSVCTVSGASLTLVANGTCTIAADQAGDLEYLATSRVTRSFLVTGTLPMPGRLGNIATRGPVFAGNDVMIAGFIIGGFTSKTVAIVGIGPSLTGFGISNALVNPTLTLVRSSNQSVVATNDNWQLATNAAQIQASGYAPTDPAESAILTTLAPGAYTAILSGAGGGTGVGLVGVYEVDHPEVPLTNISTRGQVLTGNDVMIGGFVIQGDNPQTVAIVATGPSLTQYGIANALANPTLTLVRASDQAVIATNDDWQAAANAAQIQSSGLAPSNPLESAILITLAPGAYTAILSGAGGGTGVGVVAVWAR